MFGVVPKSIWQKTNPPDERNLCNWAMRCLLIEDGNTLMLIDNGLGDKQDESFLVIIISMEPIRWMALLASRIFNDDITDMFLSHLHFDHCGGGIKRMGDKLNLHFQKQSIGLTKIIGNGPPNLTPAKKQVSSKKIFYPCKRVANLNLSKKKKDIVRFDFMDIFYASGHTDKMMIPKIRYKIIQSALWPIVPFCGAHTIALCNGLRYTAFNYS
jgi:ribonuclease BN (tRNA processing enzyme)